MHSHLIFDCSIQVLLARATAGLAMTFRLMMSAQANLPKQSGESSTV